MSALGLRRPLIWGIACAIALGSCAPARRADLAVASSGPERGGTLVFAKAKDANRLDPSDIDDGESSAVTENLFDGLVRFKRGGTEVEPDLATSWQTSADGLTYTFHLRPGVVFHDGTPCDAAAVQFSFDRQRHPLEGQEMSYWKDFFADSVAGEDVVDPLTLRIRLKATDATFLSKLAMFSMGIVSPAAARRWGADFGRHPVGTGPFRFVEWVPDQKIVLAANDRYWGGRPYLDRVIFKPVLDNSVRLLELEVGGVAGEAGVGAMDGLNPDDLPRVVRNPELAVLSQPGLNVGYLALDTHVKPLDNVLVRRAINMAIDKKRLVDAFFAGGKLGEVAVNPMPPILWGYDRSVRDYPHDPAAARRLLARAGFPHGFDMQLWAMPVARPYMPMGAKIAEAIQGDLRQVGIRAKIVSYEWATYLDKMGNLEHQAALIGWIGDYGDPDNFLYTFFYSGNTQKGGASNYADYRNPKVDALLIRARRSTDPAVRIACYRQVQEIVHDDAPWVPLFYAKQLAVERRDVRGYALQPTGSKLFDGVWLTDGGESAGGTPALRGLATRSLEVARASSRRELATHSSEVALASNRRSLSKDSLAAAPGAERRRPAGPWGRP